MKNQYIFKNRNSRVLFFLFSLCLLSVGKSYSQMGVQQVVTNVPTFISALGGINNAYCSSVGSDGEFYIVLAKDIVVENPILLRSGTYHLMTIDTNFAITFAGDQPFITVEEEAALRLGTAEQGNSTITIQRSASSTHNAMIANYGELTFYSSLEIRNGEFPAVYHLDGAFNLYPEVELHNHPIRIGAGQSIHFMATPEDGKVFYIEPDTIQYCMSYISVNEENDFQESHLSSFHFHLPDTMTPFITGNGKEIALYEFIIEESVDTCYSYYFEEQGITLTNDTLLYVYDQDDCRKIHLRHFFIKQDFTNELFVDICLADLPFQYDTLTTYTAGMHFLHYESENYCDSIIIINLTILDGSNTFLNDTVCEGELPYFVGDSAIYNTGTYEIHLTNQWGCDSTAHLNLTVNQGYFTLETVEVCPSALPYSYQDKLLTESGMYKIYGSGENPCDSFIYLSFVVLPEPEIAISGRDNACIGDSILLSVNEMPGYVYVWNNEDSAASTHVFESGDFSVTVTGSNGCVAETSHAVNFTHRPEISFITDYDPYNFDRATITANGGDYFEWSTGDSVSVITVSDPGTYSVIVSSGAFCSSSSSVTIYDFTPNVVITESQSICKGDSILLTVEDLNDPEATFFWSTGETTSSITVTPIEETTYFVTVVNSRGDSVEVNTTLTFYDMESYKIVGENSFCEYAHTTLSVSNALHCVWSTGENGNAVFIDEAGMYKVTITTPDGCMKEDSMMVVKKLKPNSTINTSGATTFCIGKNVTLQADGGVSYLWNTGESTRNITVSEFGKYVVTVTGNNGCSDTASRTIKVNTIPSAQFTVTDNICAGQQAIIEANGDPEYSYRWSTGETSSILIAYPQQNSIYRVTVTSEDECSKEYSFHVAVHALPEVSIFGESPICQGDTTILSAYGATSYHWSTGEKTNEIKVSRAGIYYVTATGDGGCTKSFSYQLATIPAPNPSITGNSSFCQGSSTTLTANSGNQYVWNTGATTPSITVNQSGIYSVTVSNTNGCSKIISKEVSAIGAPSVQITGNRSFCANSSHLISASGDADNSYSWSTGEGGASISITSAGTYTVTATNSIGCQSSLSASFSVLEIPHPVISGNENYCEGDQPTLSVSPTNGLTFVWNDGSTGTFIRPKTTDTYSVTATNIANGCSQATSKTIIFQPKPNIQISGNTKLCLGSSTTLTASGGTQYSWTTGENTPYITVTPTSTTNYTVYVTNTITSCSATKDVAVTVNPMPTPSITGQENLCVGSQVTLNAHGGASYLWDNDLQTSSITVSQSGVYHVTAITDSGCRASTSFTVYQRALPNVTIAGGEAGICQGTSATLTANGGVSYVWSNGSSASSINVNQAGNYSVTATDTYLCQSIATREISVHALPVFAISGADAFCQGSSSVLTASGDVGLGYQWSTGVSSPSVTITASGEYFVTATNANQCVTVKSKSVIQNSLPVATITGDQSICPGGSTILTAEGGVSYHWSNDTLTARNTVSPTTSTVYTVTVTNANNCSKTTSVNVTINPMPNVTFTGNTSYCAGLSTEITAHGGASFLWSNEDINATTTISSPGLYSVTATNGLGCSQSASVNIIENPVPEVNISGINTLCVGESRILTASGGSTYLWTTDETSASINVSPTQTTSYTVTASNEYSCTGTAEITITVNPLPEASISGNSSGCQGDTVTLTALGGTSYFWNIGSQESVYPATVQGTYIVTATNEYGCSATASKLLTFNSLPIPIINGIANFCDGDFTTLTANGGISYQWNTGSSATEIIVDEANTYTVTVTNADGCSATTSVTTSLLASPQIMISGNRPLCQGETNTLYATGGLTYEWNDGSTANSLTVSPNTTTTYSVTATNHLNCTSSINIDVMVHPVYSINYEDAICINNAYQRYGFNLPIQDSAGIFTHVQNLSSGTGCDSVITLTLTVKPKPIITEAISGNEYVNIAGNYTYIINNVQHANAYQWSISNPNWEIQQSSQKNVILTINTTGTGNLTVLAVNDCGLSESTTLTIQSDIVSVEEYEKDQSVSFFPNPTTHHITVKNEHPFPIHIEIYDMNGKLMLRSEQIEQEAQIQTIDFASGNYILRILGNNKVLGSSKMVKL